ncbi:MAG TPA: hypothetical protein DD734_05015 [Firmicutes bacterium]|nr:hypothetical protein [Bacillota bacterium]HBR33974.1 hypothetical protein [Bacillota bacterium]
MRRFLFYLVPTAILVLAVAVMLSADWLKKPRSQAEDVGYYLVQLDGDLKEQSWTEAVANLEKLKTAWFTMLPRLQFSIERDEAVEINLNLARLRGLINGRSQAAALAELNEIRTRWHNLTQ